MTDQIQESLPDPPAKVHFIGIGGIGMSGLARILHSFGYLVTGSDIAANDQTIALAADGVRFSTGHTMIEEARAADLVVMSAAVSPENPELMAAVEANVSVIKRAELLGLLANQRRSVAVSGSHGKSTTAGMLVSALTDLGEAPAYAIGAVVAATGTNSDAGTSEVMIVEADEFDRSFHWLRPDIAIVTNVEYDHPDIFQTVDDYEAAFVDFLAGVKNDGVIIVSADDPGARRVIERGRSRLSARIISFGENEPADWSISRQGDAWQVTTPTGNKLPLRVGVPGKHNVLNATAALIALDLLGVPTAAGVAALGRYAGVGRRFELKGERCGVTIIDDYAHHPTEIRATIEAARSRYPGKRIWAVFQPHTYSRTKTMLDAFAAELEMADEVMVLDIYASRETDSLGISKDDLVSKLTRLPFLATGVHEASDALAGLVQSGDLVLTMGAGDITRLGDQLLSKLQIACPAVADQFPVHDSESD